LEARVKAAKLEILQMLKAAKQARVRTERMLRTFWVLESCSYRKRKERTLY
jgi:hypothetical protein